MQAFIKLRDLSKNYGNITVVDQLNLDVRQRKKMIDPTARLSISRQAIVLGISRGSVYYKPRPVSGADLKLMQRIDKLHMEFPFAGSRMLQGLLVQEGFKVGRLHIATLMKRMGIEALFCRGQGGLADAQLCP